MAESRNAINVLIKLLGGAEMTAELKNLGASGEKALASIQDAASKVQLAGLGNNIANAIAQTETVIRRAAIGLGLLKAAADAGAAALFFLAKSGADAAVSANNAAQAAGLSAKAYQEWAFAADGIGVSQAQLGTALNTFNKQVIKTADETTKAGKAGAQMGRDIQQGIGFSVETFKDLNVEVTRFGESTKGAGDKAKAGAGKIKTGFDDLGISVKNTDGTLKTNEQLLIAVANAFQKMPDGARKSAVAIKLFGLEGAKLIPLLDKGAAGIEEFKARAAELGIVFTDDQIKSALAFDDALTELQKSASGLLRQIGLIFVPAFTTGANAFRDIILRNRAAVLDFANVALARGKVLVEDFFAALSGRDADVSTNGKWITQWRDAIVGFGQDALRVFNGVVIPAIEGVRKGADLAAKAINALGGAGISGGDLLITFGILRAVGAIRLITEAATIAVKGIALISSALLLTPAGRVFLLIAAGVEAVGVAVALLRGKQNDATTSAEGHRKALDDLKAAMDAVKNSVPGAREQLKQLAETQLAAAKAALTTSEDQLARMKDNLDQLKASAFNSPLGADDIQAATDAYVQAEIRVAQRTRELKDIGDTLAGKVVGNIEDMRQTATKGADGVNQLGTAVDQTSGKVENLDHQITVFRGGGAGGISKEVFDVIDGVAHRADQSKAALDGVAASGQTVADKLKNVSNEVTNSVQAVPDAIKPDAASAAVNGIVDDVGKIAPAAQDAASSVSDALGNIDASGAEVAAAAFAAPFTGLPGQISTIISGIQSLVQGGFANLAATVSSLAGQIRSEIAQIISALQAAVAQAQQLRAQASSSSPSSGGGSQGGFAEGGHVVGPGGPKTDSILAWLSNGEFVMQAAAVRRLGVGFLHALNSGFIPSLKSLKGFSVGGAVDNFSQLMAIPRYAGGGLASMQLAPASTGNLTPLHFHLDGGKEVVIDAVGISDFTLQQLQKTSLRGARVSAGRAPMRR
ncbi:phage tail tape measure protein [Mesorhizobium sp. B1-1-7]|uniref:phage tail tape measure protein n=1 Tax=Mesorhizobium sp. B1-1-7 TaxID=2589977 RepID=UPI001129F9D6|nr:phage tail tape measure protein [Mesorhizobium sp. B1-1-7]TPN49346.1 phage tail tape measure protein [Mesorhizobium sp. B1-1-7]